ncbi:MAG: glycosyltransferase family 9 protein [Akkermansia sp.]
MKNILVIKLGALGDVVLSIGTFFKIREQHPEARITLLTMPAFVEMTKQCGVFDEIITDTRPPSWRIDLLWSCVKRIANKRFDLIYDMQNVKRTEFRYYNLLRLLSPISFAWVSKRKFIKNVEKKHPWGRGKETCAPFSFPYALSNLTFLRGPETYFSELPARFILFIPGCSPKHPEKRWPTENYIALAKLINHQHISVVVMGTKDEESVVSAIAKASPDVINFLNKTTLLDIPQLATKALAVVGNDTGPTHISSLSGALTIGLYPYRTRKSVLTGNRAISIVSPDTIDQITVGQVWEKLKDDVNISH